MTAFKRKLIGKGAFTKAYQVGENEVEVVSFCPAKECYAMFSQGNKFAPVIELKETGKYKMPLYPKVKAPSRDFNAQALAVYKTLRQIGQDAIGTNLDYYKFCVLIEKSTLTDDDKEAIIDLAGNVGNGISPDDMRFEISPRNVSYNAQGDLILMDCFFSIATLRTSYKMRGRSVRW